MIRWNIKVRVWQGKTSQLQPIGNNSTTTTTIKHQDEQARCTSSHSYCAGKIMSLFLGQCFSILCDWVISVTFVLPTGTRRKRKSWTRFLISWLVWCFFVFLTHLGDKSLRENFSAQGKVLVSSTYWQNQFINLRIL